MKKQNRLRGPILLAITAFIWGTSFVAQSIGMDYIEPFTFTAARSFVGSLVLIPVILVLKWKKVIGKEGNWLKGGIICGVFLFFASVCQQFGILYTSAGEAGFLTALYIVIVPVLGIFMGKRAGAKVWIAVAVSLVGAFLLSVKDGFEVSRGVWWLLACAVLFSFHILVCDKYGSEANPVKVSCVQFFTCGVLSLIFALVLETPTVYAVSDAIVPILYCGVMSSGVAYTLQIVGQRYTQPTVASLILSLESVFSALAGWIILNEVLSTKQLIGCVLVFTAVVLAQLPAKLKRG
ncbi:MAG: DMT family transporter [Clostridia bacterium]|nr:DMT family transporter [Clostridia bacterium]